MRLWDAEAPGEVPVVGGGRQGVPTAGAMACDDQYPHVCLVSSNPWLSGR